MSQSPGVEYAKQEIAHRIREMNAPPDFADLNNPLRSRQATATIEYFAEHLEEIYGKFEQQQKYNRQLEEALKAATEAVESLSQRIYKLERR